MFHHALDYRVAYGDTDKMGFVYYGNYLALFERTRTELLRANGLAYADLEARGIAMPVVEAHLNYHAPARYDDVVSCYGELTSFKGLRVIVSCRIMLGETLLVDGYTVLTFMDMATGRPKRIDSELRALFEKLAENTP